MLLFVPPDPFVFLSADFLPHRVQPALFDPRVWLVLSALERCLELTRLFVLALVHYVLPRSLGFVSFRSLI